MKKTKKKTPKKANSKKSAPVKLSRKIAKKPAAKKGKVSSPKPQKTKKSAPKAVSPRKIMDMLLKEMEREAKTTRKFFERIPEEKYDWRPHPKSMTMRRLATHIAELPSWITMMINTKELDFEGSKYVPRLAKNNKELLEILEKSLATARESLNNSSDDILTDVWVMRSGDKIFSSNTKDEVLRSALSQTIHHRAQLGVFLRLLDIPIPGSYGPSADESNFN